MTRFIHGLRPNHGLSLFHARGHRQVYSGRSGVQVDRKWIGSSVRCDPLPRGPRSAGGSKNRAHRNSSPQFDVLQFCGDMKDWEYLEKVHQEDARRNVRSARVDQ